MSSCPCFRRFHKIMRLDNRAAGIPNAIKQRPRRKPMSNSKDAVRKVLDAVKADRRTSLTAPEGKLVCDAYGIPVPKEGVAKSASEAAKLAADMGFPVVMKIVSPDILHKTEAGGVVVGVKTAADAEKSYETILANAKKYKADAKIEGIQVQQMLAGGTEVIVGSITDGSFGKLVAFGLGGGLVEGLKQITFRLAPASKDDARSVPDGIQAQASGLLGYKAYKSVKDVPGVIDTAVFAIPAKFVAGALVECGEKKIPGAVLIPSGFAEAGAPELQAEIVEIGQKYNVRLMGPNIYGFYYTPANLCATFCTAYDVKGHAALSSQSGGIGMAIIGFSRSAKMGVSAIVGLGNKSDIDEDDLLAFFEQDPNTTIIAQHCEDLKDGRAFAEAAKRVSRKKPVVVLKAGRTSAGAKAASSHTGALAGNDKIYEDVFKQSGVIRARSLRQLLEFARGMPVLPTPKGENVLIITGAGGSVVLLSDSVVDNGLSLMRKPPSIFTRTAFRPTLIRPNCRSRCSAPNTNGRAGRACCNEARSFKHPPRSFSDAQVRIKDAPSWRRPESITPNRGYGFRARSRSLSSGRPKAGPVGLRPGMTIGWYFQRNRCIAQSRPAAIVKTAQHASASTTKSSNLASLPVAQTSRLSRMPIMTTHTTQITH